MLHRLALLCLATIDLTMASNCSSGGTTIFFGNGILTTEQSARAALWDLKPRVDGALDVIQPSRDKACVQYSLAYDSEFTNASGAIATVKNVVGQIVDAAAQAGLTDYATVWTKLFQYSTTVLSLPDGWDQALGQQFSNILIETTAPVQADLEKQRGLYQAEVNGGNNVITVAHSQGNLYVNEAFVLVSVPSSQHFNVVGVATPGDHVAGGGPWVTLQNDIILLVPFALPANTVNNNNSDRCGSVLNLASRTRCHDFEESYLKGDVSEPMIINAVTSKILSVQGCPMGIIYSTFGPNDTYTLPGWQIGGQGNEPITGGGVIYYPGERIAAPFIPSATATLQAVRLPLTFFSGENSAVVALMQGSGVPITTLETWSVAAQPGIQTLESNLHPVLSAGTQYWLMVAAGNPTSQLGWPIDNQGINGLAFKYEDPIPWGNSWFFMQSDQGTAFEVCKVLMPQL
jgi:hypothetical protein